MAQRRGRRGPGLPLAAWRGSDPRSPPFGAGAPGLRLVLQHPAGPFSFPAGSAVTSTLGLPSPPPLFAPLSSPHPSRADGREGRVRSRAEARGTVWEQTLMGVWGPLSPRSSWRPPKLAPGAQPSPPETSFAPFVLILNLSIAGRKEPAVLGKGE